MSTTLTHTDLARVAERAIHATLGGSVADLATVVHPDAVNRMSITEPPATRGPGPTAFHATGEWLRTAFSDLAWTTENEVVEDDLVVTYGTLAGRQTGDFVVWTPEGTVERAYELLEGDGVVERRGRAGTFLRVRPTSGVGAHDLTELDEAADALAVIVRQLGVEEIAAHDALARAFDRLR